MSEVTAGIEIAVGLLTYQRRPGLAGDWEREAARRADEAGVASIWFSEHHFSHDGYLPSAVPAMADVLARTDRLGVGTGVALLPFHDVDRLAAGLRTLAASGRQVDYGVGLAYRDEEFDGFGLRRRERARIFEGKLVALLGALDGTPGVRLWVGAIAGPAVERAARLGLPVVFPTGSTHAEIGRRIRRYHEAAPGTGTPRFGVIRDIGVGPPGFDAHAWFGEVVDPVYVEYLQKTVIQRGGRPALGSDLTGEERSVWLQRFRDAAVLGTPGELAAELARLQALGVTLCVLRCWFPTVGAAAQLEALDRVLAALRQLRGEGARR